jgi:hypothetical protein
MLPKFWTNCFLHFSWIIPANFRYIWEKECHLLMQRKQGYCYLEMETRPPPPHFISQLQFLWYKQTSKCYSERKHLYLAIKYICSESYLFRVSVMVFNATFNNISVILCYLFRTSKKCSTSNHNKSDIYI